MAGIIIPNISNAQEIPNLPDSRSFLFSDNLFLEKFHKLGNLIGFIPTGLKNFLNFCQKHPNVKKILAFGDSWIYYPAVGGDGLLPLGTDGNLLDCTRDRKTVAIYKIGANGAKLRDVLHAKHFPYYQTLFEAINPHLVFISLGGNDLAGAENFSGFLRQRSKPVDHFTGYIHMEDLQERLVAVRASYLTFLKQFANYPSVKKVLSHCYDDATYSITGANLSVTLGMGFKPMVIGNPRVPTNNFMTQFMVQRNIPTQFQANIIRYVLGGLKTEVLDGVTHENANFDYVNTYGVLERYALGNLGVLQGIPLTSENTTPQRFWLNEIHPTAAGYRILEEMIYTYGIKPILNQMTD
jgi:lysophospholipase L1-like esterase